MRHDKFLTIFFLSWPKSSTFELANGQLRSPSYSDKLIMGTCLLNLVHMCKKALMSSYKHQTNSFTLLEMILSISRWSNKDIVTPIKL